VIEVGERGRDGDGLEGLARDGDFAGLWILGKLAAALQNSYLRHAPPGTWGVPGDLHSLPILGAFLWMILLYTALRYGVRDRVTQLALGLAGMITAPPWSMAGVSR
jgi:hypothetical protein